MNVILKPVDESNWLACADLKLADGQAHFMPANLFSIAQSKFFPHWHVVGIYDRDMLVGFAMYGLDLTDNSINLIRLMIDAQHQGKGYGKAALAAILAAISQQYGSQTIWLSISPRNTAAERLYKGFGFTIEQTGLETEDEIFLCLKPA
jgi:diamine N-acetyltransferase